MRVVVYLSGHRKNCNFFSAFRASESMCKLFFILNGLVFVLGIFQIFNFMFYLTLFKLSRILQS